MVIIVDKKHKFGDGTDLVSLAGGTFATSGEETGATGWTVRNSDLYYKDTSVFNGTKDTGYSNDATFFLSTLNIPDDYEISFDITSCTAYVLANFPVGEEETDNNYVNTPIYLSDSVIKTTSVPSIFTPHAAKETSTHSVIVISVDLNKSSIYHMAFGSMLALLVMFI